MPTIDLDQILTQDPQEPEWIIRKFLPRDTLTILAGLEGSGKSSLSYAMALSIALGRPFLGRETTQTKVLYFDSENSHPDCSQYIRQTWLGLGCPAPSDLRPFLRVEHFSLTNEWQRGFKAACDAFAPGLVIVDTANACFSIKDENSNAEAAEVLSFIQFARPARASVLLMKHEREHKDGMGKSVRGAKYWLGAVDQVVYLHRQPGAPLRFEGETWHKTKLVPAKKRAYGLDSVIFITPEQLRTPLGKSLIFHGV